MWIKDRGSCRAVCWQTLSQMYVILYIFLNYFSFSVYMPMSARACMQPQIFFYKASMYQQTYVNTPVSAETQLSMKTTMWADGLSASAYWFEKSPMQKSKNV